ncbi:SDR family NAD(P)-dependent oxidoreductase [Roseivirga pacifica]|uniref:SDR family NAD(P)-dependent oxidoreductase n=1 Tax=Roseivirga pacifica TaxID=1267423 RepID=UPI002095DA0B|nr:SDR family NAD(P)-dependent oxidoreductase [Roseivirga pacifica]MCO6359484.1 SDR family NAD(P)-dependent oxidoreductase [Roseivirga pacifica]MCO6366854.1 SDR family NAD(P)-dependent oxidoreductase [Roseivirga pacifica]MCO6370614.1 SDR family NAD(P)-dependent oxidoreductase [Roseivirga pacifica]MCO6374510.1 SDR family NAD(P)-dependent oxidoreductase [Roseivirga pacifica]MCO6379769.1 SDR family NAD(P)-dependent oxidoreductase [Roseivirga pacifica]
MSSKCFIITGASTGLGKAMKDYLLSSTAHQVISLSRKPEPTDEQNARISYHCCDLNDLGDFDLTQVLKPYLDCEELVLVNNAATIHPLDAVGKFTREDLESYFRINVSAPICLMNDFVTLAQQAKLYIINISSGAANRAIGHWSLYCSAKAAMQMFCDVLAVDHSSIAVANIDPGVLDTQMQREIRSSDIPDLEVFSGLAENNQLKKPLDAAGDILAPYL